MKTFFSLTFVVLLLLSAIAWKMQPKAVEGGKTQLVWVSDDNPARRQQLALFNEKYPTYHATLDPNNTGLEKVVVQSLAGVGPDLFDAGEGNLNVLIDSDIAWDITDELKKRGVDVERDVWKAMQSISVRDGRVYGFPSNAASNAIFINKPLFDKAGIPYPKGSWTWEQFLPVAQKLTLRDEKGRATQFGVLVDWWLWPQFVIQWGGRVYSEDGTKCVIDSPQAIAGVQFLHDLIYKYKVMPSPVEEAAMATQGGWGSGTITQFGEGHKAAMALGGRWWLCTLRNKTQFPDLHTTVCESPYHDKRVFLSYGRATFINKNSPRREDALNFILYMAGQGYNDLINDQADALAPVVKFSYTPHYLHNPEFPEEDNNDVWRRTMEMGEPNRASPFVNTQAADRILTKQLDLVKNDQKPVADALRTAAQQINEEIRKNLDRNPTLKAKYDILAQRGARKQTAAAMAKLPAEAIAR
jgi:multiple sugar transport system substrate-binding protein